MTFLEDENDERFYHPLLRSEYDNLIGQLKEAEKALRGELQKRSYDQPRVERGLDLITDVRETMEKAR